VILQSQLHSHMFGKFSSESTFENVVFDQSRTIKSTKFALLCVCVRACVRACMCVCACVCTCDSQKSTP